MKLQIAADNPSGVLRATLTDDDGGRPHEVGTLALSTATAYPRAYALWDECMRRIADHVTDPASARLPAPRPVVEVVVTEDDGEGD
jgi:hypothetical protein